MINFYKIIIKGKDVNRFFKKILKEKVNIFDVKYKKNEIELKVSYDNYLKILKVNTIYKIDIIDIRGYKKYQKLFSFYKLFLILMFMGICLIYIYSKMVFFIEIKTKNSELKDLIALELKTHQISLFAFSKPYNRLNSIAKDIKNTYKDKLEWIEIKHDGVKYEINLIEKINRNNKADDLKHNIVASFNGFIKDMYVTSGEIIKNKGDYVNKGDVIVSGLIVKNEDIKNIVDANADVYAEVWYKVKLSQSFIYNHNYNHDGYKKIVLNVLNKDIVLFKLKQNNLKKEEKTILLSNDLFKLFIKKEYKENLVKKKYRYEDLKNKLESIAKAEIEKGLLEQEYIMLQKTLKINTLNDKMNIEIFFKVYKNIAEKVLINIE